MFRMKWLRMSADGQHETKRIVGWLVKTFPGNIFGLNVENLVAFVYLSSWTRQKRFVWKDNLTSLEWNISLPFTQTVSHDNTSINVTFLLNE